MTAPEIQNTQDAPMNVTPASPLVENTSPAVTNETFIDTISEDLRGQSNLKDFRDVNHLAKSYVELQRMVGNSVRIPPNDATPEALKDFREKIKEVDGVLLKDDENLLQKLGRPEAAESYNFEDIMQNELIHKSPELVSDIDSFRKEAFELGLTDTQAKALIGNRLETLKTDAEANDAYVTQSQQELQKLWGQDYDNRINAAKTVAKVYQEKYGDHMNDLINSKAGSNPVVLQMLSELAEVYKEKKHVGLQSVKFGMTPDGARQKISDKKSDKGFMEAYMDERHPGHKKAVNELHELYVLAQG